MRYKTADPIDYSQIEQLLWRIPSPCNHNIPKAYSPEKLKCIGSKLWKVAKVLRVRRGFENYKTYILNRGILGFLSFFNLLTEHYQ